MDTFWFWIAFGIIVAGILVFDLGVVGRQKQNVGLRESLLMVAGYVTLAVLFGLALFIFRDRQSGLEYFTAYLLEESLSLDNIFLWVLIFDYLKVPERARHKVLFWGIVGAMVLRGVFIFAGAALINAFDWMLYVFGALVIFSAIRLLRSGGGKDEGDVGDNRVLVFLRERLHVTQDYKGEKFFIEDNGHRRATPLLLALLVIETTDLVFALDSIPAIFGVTHDTLIVYSSNIFAILGLRAAYFAVAGLVEHLRYLRYGLALLMLLVGAKMITSSFIEIPIWLTLAATVAILGGTIGLSLLRRRAEQ